MGRTKRPTRARWQIEIVQALHQRRSHSLIAALERGRGLVARHRRTTDRHVFDFGNKSVVVDRPEPAALEAQVTDFAAFAADDVVVRCHRAVSVVHRLFRSAHGGSPPPEARFANSIYAQSGDAAIRAASKWRTTDNPGGSTASGLLDHPACSGVMSAPAPCSGSSVLSTALILNDDVRCWSWVGTQQAGIALVQAAEVELK